MKILSKRWPWNKGKKGLQVAWNKGKKCPQLSGKNNGMFGKKSPGQFKKSGTPWNKGLTKETDERVKGNSKRKTGLHKKLNVVS